MPQPPTSVTPSSASTADEIPATGAPTRGVSPSFLILLAALVAAAAKLYCAATTIGSNDAATFYAFARAIEQVGVTGIYDFTPLYNHTPFIGELILGALRAARATETSFSFWLRLPGIVADFGSVLALLWVRARTGKPPWWALAVFALSPVSFMVSGFHGNVDSILVFFLLLSACACVAEKPVWCGVFLGLACNVKVAPLILIPIFAFYWFSRRRPWRFAAALGGTVLLGWGAALAFAPSGFARNVLSYAGYWGEWGITCALHATGWAAFQPMGFAGLTSAERIVITILKICIVGGITTIAWRKRTAAPSEIFSTLALSWILFFVLAPGSAPQYLVWFAPFLLIYSPRWYLAVTIACTIFLTVFYTVICHGLPWNFGRSTPELSPLIRPWTALPWLALAALFVVSLREMFASPARLESPSPTS